MDIKFNYFCSFDESGIFRFGSAIMNNEGITRTQRSRQTKTLALIFSIFSNSK